MGEFVMYASMVSNKPVAQHGLGVVAVEPRGASHRLCAPAPQWQRQRQRRGGAAAMAGANSTGTGGAVARPLAASDATARGGISA